MISYKKNKYGDICSFIEWWYVDKEGNMVEGKKGEYVYINYYYTCPKYRSKYRSKYRQIFNKILDRIIYRLPENIKYVYWIRDKHNGRKSIYPVSKFIKKRKVTI